MCIRSSTGSLESGDESMSEQAGKDKAELDEAIEMSSQDVRFWPWITDMQFQAVGKAMMLCNHRHQGLPKQRSLVGCRRRLPPHMHAFDFLRRNQHARIVMFSPCSCYFH